MKRMFKIGAGSLMATSMLAGTLALVGPGAASATTSSRHLSRAPVTMACSMSRNYSLPKTTTLFRAGTAGTVRIAVVNSGSIRVASAHATKGWRVTIDSSLGSSVDVYFRNGTHTVKFEAEINDAGGLTVRTIC